MTTADHIAAARAAVAQAKRDWKAAPEPNANVDHLRALTRKPETDENGSAA